MPTPYTCSGWTPDRPHEPAVLALADIVAVLADGAPGRLPSELLSLGDRPAPPALVAANNATPPPRLTPALLPPPELPAAGEDPENLGELTLPTPSSNLRRIETLSQELWELRLVSLSDGDYHGQQLHRLRRRLVWLLLGSGGAIALSLTALAWTSWRLHAAEGQLHHYATTLEQHQQQLAHLERERLAQLESQLQSLRAELPESLANDFATSQKTVAALERDVENLEATLTNHEDALTALLNALQQGLAPPRQP